MTSVNAYERDMDNVNKAVQALLRTLNGTRAPLSSEKPRRLLEEVMETNARADLFEERANAEQSGRAAQTDQPKEQTALAVFDMQDIRDSDWDEGELVPWQTVIHRACKLQRAETANASTPRRRCTCIF